MCDNPFLFSGRAEHSKCFLFYISQCFDIVDGSIDGTSSDMAANNWKHLDNRFCVISGN
jgi:hypothetical protein